MHDYQKLRVWRHSCRVALAVYDITENFPLDERYGFISQMRRASVSIPSNLAEGAGRGSNQDFARYVRIATGSACELETQLLLVRMIPKLAPHIPAEILSDVLSLKRMLHRLEVSLKPRQSSPST